VIGVCIAFAELTAQVMSVAPKNHVGKAAGLNRAVGLVAATMTPLIAGYYIDTFESGLLCYSSAALSIFAFGLVHKFGGFMNSYSQRLPLGHKRDD
jgi:MFS family permease